MKNSGLQKVVEARPLRKFAGQPPSRALISAPMA